MPRKAFDLQELRAAGAIDVGRPVNLPDLTVHIHDVFLRWDDTCDDEIYNLLYPSIQLATNLIHVGMPYIANFLPIRTNRFWNRRDDGVRINPNPSAAEMAAADQDLSRLAGDLAWTVNAVMYPNWGWFGVTRHASNGEPWTLLSLEEVMRSDARHRAQGRKYRPLIMGLMSEYITAIRDSDPGSEPHLRATFMAAITMTHEIGHAIFNNDFRGFYNEPHVGDECEAELGYSFISWIFSGFHPQFMRGDIEFQQALGWETQFTASMSDRPIDRKYYSIPISYLERVFSQRFWDDLGAPDQPDFSARARTELRPDTDEQGGRVATELRPEWEYSFLGERPIWIARNDFKLPGFRAMSYPEGMTQEEIDYERDLTKDEPQNLRDASYSREKRQERYKVKRQMLANSSREDDDDSDFARCLARAASRAGPSGAGPSRQPTALEISRALTLQARHLSSIGRGRRRSSTASGGEQSLGSGVEILEQVEDYEADEGDNEDDYDDDFLGFGDGDDDDDDVDMGDGDADDDDDGGFREITRQKIEAEMRQRLQAARASHMEAIRELIVLGD